MTRFIHLILLCLLLAACASGQRAPVIDRAPVAKPAVKPAASDWRPNTYVVKKGDTLYSIGLEHGYDYKEIAAANNIPPPYTIYVGQRLQLKPAASQAAAASPQTATAAPQAPSDDGGVIVTPLKIADAPTAATEPVETGSSEPAADATSSDMAGTTVPGAVAGEARVISEPRALRQPYSEEALNAPIVQAQAEPAPVAPTANPAASASDSAATPAGAATATSGGITWSWPASGPLLAAFNQGGNAKGIDIGGSSGQPILAAAPGKVIYSGSDLRGYGKLVIIKHNSDFLSVYAHNSKIVVKEGEQVTRGQRIAEMGDTDTDRIKLHFEIRRQGKSVDPAEYLPPQPQ